MKILEKVSTLKSYVLICNNAAKPTHLDNFLLAEQHLELNDCLCWQLNINLLLHYLVLHLHIN